MHFIPILLLTDFRIEIAVSPLRPTLAGAHATPLRDGVPPLRLFAAASTTPASAGKPSTLPLNTPLREADTYQAAPSATVTTAAASAAATAAVDAQTTARLPTLAESLAHILESTSSSPAPHRAQRGAAVLLVRHHAVEQQQQHQQQQQQHHQHHQQQEQQQQHQQQQQQRHLSMRPATAVVLPLQSAAKMASIAAHLTSGYDSLDDGHDDNADADDRGNQGNQRSHGGNGRSRQPFNAHLSSHSSHSGDGDGGAALNSNPTRMLPLHHRDDDGSGGGRDEGSVGDGWDEPSEWSGDEDDEDADDENAVDEHDLVRLGRGVLRRLRVERDRAMASEMNEKQVLYPLFVIARIFRA
jgi:hypothetical protein